MTITGKKIVKLTAQEKDTLFSAQLILEALYENLEGTDDYLEDTIDNLSYIRTKDLFEVDLAEE